MSSSEPRIFFATRKWAPATGGMETWALRLTDEMRKHEPVEVVALPGEDNGMPPRLSRLLRFPITVCKAWWRRKSVPAVMQLGDMALWPIALLARLSGGETQIVIAAHGTDAGYHRRGGLKGTLYGLYLKLGRSLLGNVTVIANSQATAVAVRETGWQDVRIVRLGTDLRPPEKTPSAMRRLLFVGRLLPLKGCSWFVREVLPLLPEDITLDIAGTAWDAQEAAVLDHPRVKMLGRLDHRQLAEAYAAALCVVVPNISVPTGEYEGFGLVAPEAAAAGGVVLASDRDGLRDAVVDGHTGFLLPSGEAQAWADKIREVAAWDHDTRTAVTRTAQAEAQRIYSWARVAEEVLAAYTSPAASPMVPA